MKDWFEERGFTAPWRAEDATNLKPLGARETNDARRMLWLKTSVRPMIERLKAHHSIHELREALGLLYAAK